LQTAAAAMAAHCPTHRLPLLPHHIHHSLAWLTTRQGRGQQGTCQVQQPVKLGRGWCNRPQRSRAATQLRS